MILPTSVATRDVGRTRAQPAGLEIRLTRWFCVALVLAMGCGQPSDSSRAPNSATPISPQARKQALDAAVDQWNRAHRPDGTIDTAAVLTWVRTQPIFQAAELTSSGLRAHFTDGHDLDFFVTPPGDTTAGTTTTRGVRTPIFAPVHNVPKGREAVVLDGFLCWSGGTGYVDEVLNGQGYDAGESKAASVGNLRSLVKDVSVLHLATHGNPYRLTTTDEVPEVETDEGILADLNAVPKRLDFSISDKKPADRDRCSGEATYDITGDFIRKYWHFTDDSMVYLNACSAIDDTIFPSFELTRSVRDANASMVIGWSVDITGGYAIPASRYVYTRLLGARDYLFDDNSTTPQRPWPWEDVRDGLARANMNPPASELHFLLLKDDFGGLRPSLAYFLINEREGKEGRIYLTGSFGRDLGPDSRLMVGDVEVPRSDIIKWGDSEIQADLPASASGDVVVISRDKKSNPVPLTQWELSTHWDWRGNAGVGPGQPHRETADCVLRFRGDVHGFRRHADEKPAAGKVSSPEELGTSPWVSFHLPRDSRSSCQFNASGTWVHTLIDGQTETVTLSGSETGNIVEDGRGATVLKVMPDPVAHTLRMMLGIMSPTESRTLTDGSVTTTSKFHLSTDVIGVGQGGTDAWLAVEIDDAWNIQEMKPVTVPDNFDGIFTFSWDAAGAVNPPKRTGANAHPQ